MVRLRVRVSKIMSQCIYGPKKKLHFLEWQKKKKNPFDFELRYDLDMFLCPFLLSQNQGGKNIASKHFSHNAEERLNK